MKARMQSDWANALDPYPLAETQGAIEWLLANDPKNAINEHQVKKVILTNRSKALAAIPKQIEQVENIAEPTAESKARVQAMVDGLAKSKRMKTKPREQ